MVLLGIQGLAPWLEPAGDLIMKPEMYEFREVWIIPNSPALAQALRDGWELVGFRQVRRRGGVGKKALLRRRRRVPAAA